MRRKIHYAWIILTVSFLGVLAAQGLRYSFGAFLQPWQKDFSVSRGTVSAISLTSFIVFAVSQPLIGRFLDKYGIKKIFVTSTIILGIATILTSFATSIWQMFLLYGIISSLGFGGASGVTASLAVTKWFKKRQGLALGLVEAGFGAGQMIIVSSSLFLIEHHGWRTSVLYLGTFLLFIITPLLLIFLKASPSEIGIAALGEENKEFNQEMANKLLDDKQRLGLDFLTKRVFWCLIIPYFICGITTTGLIDTHLIPLSQSCGFSIAVTGTAVSLLAFFNTGGTILSGILADKFDNRKIITSIYFFRGISILFLLLFTLKTSWSIVFIEHPALLFVFSITFGLVDFAVVAPTIKMLSGYFQGPSLGMLTGYLYMSHQLGSALGSYLPGVWFDHSNSYASSLIAAAILLGLASFLSACLPSQTLRVKRNKGKDTAFTMKPGTTS